MGIRQLRPTNASSRFQSFPDFGEITESRPLKSLTSGKMGTGGRNNQGQLTNWFRGGGHKKRYRAIDFKRDKHGVPGTVASVEYDPNRSARIAPGHYADGEKRYIVAPLDVKVGDTIVSGPNAEIRPGNSLPISNIPVGTLIHNIEMKEGKGAQLVRSAGGAAQLLAKEGDFAQVRMPSGEVRLIHQVCYATIGQVGNLDHGNIKLGKAGRKRHLGIRPTVRGTAMSPRDHPHGGGEGRQPIGLAGPKSPWGKPTLGKKTRRNKKTDQYIVRRRSKTSR